jgi:hypothetical protein
VTPLGIVIPLALLAVTLLVFLIGGVIADAIYTGSSWVSAAWRVVRREASNVVRFAWLLIRGLR